MPLYEYECEACGHRFEEIQKFSDPPADTCPKCGERKVHKLMSSPAIKFKGSGFYINDYAAKSTAGTDSKDSKEAPAKTPAAKDTPSKESAPAPATPAPTTSKE